jgi:hypothetical protein
MTSQSLPLSAAQSGIWMGQQLAPTSPAFNMGQFVEIDGRIDEALFERAVRRVMAEVDCLQVRFADGPDGPRQHFAGQDTWEFSAIDFRQGADPRADSDAWMTADLLRPMNLTADRLTKIGLLRVGDAPFGRPGSRMYRTGDLVRWSPVGELASTRSQLEIEWRASRARNGYVGWRPRSRRQRCPTW